MNAFDFIKYAVWYFLLACWIFTGAVVIPVLLVMRAYKGWHRRQRGWHRRRSMFQRIKG